jgi:hypothetical protein
MSMLALRPFLLMLGSGMFGSPWVRMHAMKASAIVPPLALRPLGTAEGSVEVAVDGPMLATLGREEPPPQPAASTHTLTSAQTPRAVRQSRAYARSGLAVVRVGVAGTFVLMTITVRRQMLQGRNAVMVLQHPIGHPGSVSPPRGRSLSGRPSGRRNCR